MVRAEPSVVFVSPQMINKLLLTVLLGLSALAALSQNTSAPSSEPAYTASGQLRFPERYREWVYLSTGMDMSYTPGTNADHHMFDNVFVNPAAYKKFEQTGTWPDKTMLVLETRGAEGKASINQHGNFQSGEIMGLEVHVKDESRFPGKWAFFGFGDSKVGTLFPAGAACYSCHLAHGAVDTTFVQFYPTLLPIAKSKGTLSAAYNKESSPHK